MRIGDQKLSPTSVHEKAHLDAKQKHIQHLGSTTSMQQHLPKETSDTPLHWFSIASGRFYDSTPTRKLHRPAWMSNVESAKEAMFVRMDSYLADTLGKREAAHRIVLRSAAKDQAGQGCIIDQAQFTRQAWKSEFCP